MQAPRILALAAALLTGAIAAFILHPSSFIHAQGPLTPPGAPAPTMKTLDQLEARIPISTTPFTITQPGSYYLTGNLSTGTASSPGVLVNASNVTLDLNGFTISSAHPTGASSGVLVNAGRSNVRIKNGVITGTTTYSGGVFTPGGFFNGVSANGAASRDIVVSDITVSGTAATGILLLQANNLGNIVRGCNVSTCAGSGIFASTVENCNADIAGGDGITAIHVRDSHGTTVGTDVLDDGIEGGYLVENCTGVSPAGNGIVASNVLNSRAFSTTGTGINANNATNSQGSSSSGIGIIAFNATNCYGTSGTGAAGIDANPGTASYCRGSRTSGGTAINAGIAIGCTVASGTVNSLNKFLGTP